VKTATAGKKCGQQNLHPATQRPPGGTVNIEFQPQEAGDTVTVKAADASKDIDVSGLQRTPQGLYEVTVTPTDVFWNIVDSRGSRQIR